MTPEQGPERENVIDQLADLLQMLSDWVRQEARDVMREKVVLPLQRLGLTYASAQAAGCLLVVGLVFLEVGTFILVGERIGYGQTLLIIGGVNVVVSVVFLAIKMRLMQK